MTEASLDNSEKTTPPRRRLLLNRETVTQLCHAGLADLLDRPLDLEGARRIASHQNLDGTGCYLLTLVMTAIRHMARIYLAERGYRSESSGVQVSGKSHTLPGLKELFNLFQQHYPQPVFSQEERGLPEVHLTAELYLLSVQCENQAALAYRSTFDDRQLKACLDYQKLLDRLTTLLFNPAGDRHWGQPLPQLLEAPLRAAPQDLSGQLSYILEHWSAWLPEELLLELQVGKAVAAEEAQLRGGGPGPSLLPIFGRDDSDMHPAFTPDSDWMASSVLIAKSIYVWLDQLSQRYARPIGTLRDIPDEELTRLANSGFNALWLIGIWERSPASRKVKQLRGNPEAEASAYALFAYRVAEELGGDEGLADLEVRCQSLGIRLACDVVPNHTGIDSEWLRQHPDWFLQSPHPPYPGYRFTGPDLSDAPGISIRIEDGYWDHTDAAVVFEHIDKSTGQRRYLYHGNDGTHMPWNDTAQLNFLLPEVRQAMSDLIVQIARRFRLIRFDAAMTLARKHFRRLWFPPPGGSAGVPSRSTCWMSDADFDHAFPREFWRDVVDRINAEVPDTLLIAEAFWLMESYFVRTLGMHRVYNSAFMNMLKREENGKYRQLLKDTLAYNPEILKRYVNFMNNPDEATAVAQFGKGDKYFGVAVLLATLPGLPMFGHGQVEGLEEKYGMEYRRAYWDEHPDQGFIDHHWQQVFPLLRRRSLFAGVEHFSLYDFDTGQGVNENVYAYSNGQADEQYLVVFNNAPHATRGQVHAAVAKAAGGQEGVVEISLPLAQQLKLTPEKGPYCRVRNLRDQSEQLWSINQLQQGLDLDLAGYQYQVFHAFEPLQDPTGDWQKLYETLAGQSVANLDEAMLRMRFQPLWQAFQNLFAPARLQVLSGLLLDAPLVKPGQDIIASLSDELTDLAKQIAAHLGEGPPGASPQPSLAKELAGLTSWLTSLPDRGFPGKLLYSSWLGDKEETSLAPALLAWRLLQRLGQHLNRPTVESVRTLLVRFGLNLAWREIQTDPGEERDLALVLLLLKANDMQPHPALDESAFAALVETATATALIGRHEHAGEVWFNRERMIALCGLLSIQADWPEVEGSVPEPTSITPLDIFRGRLARAAAVGYRLDKFLHLE